MKACGLKRSTRLLLLCIVVALCFGCGRYKEELEAAKQQIGKLNSEIGSLNEAKTKLDKEVSRLSDELKAESNKRAQLERQVSGLQSAKASWEEEKGKLAKKNSELQEQVNSLGKQKANLEREVQGLKKSLADAASSQRPSQREVSEKPSEETAVRAASKPPEGTSPCDALVDFMRKAREIVRLNKGEQRKKLLEQLRQEYAGRIKAAPPQAVKAAEDWVTELNRSWDKPHERTTYNLLTKRNAALEACGKKPEEAGL